MIRTVAVAVLAMAAGTALGFHLCRVLAPRLYRSRRTGSHSSFICTLRIATRY